MQQVPMVDGYNEIHEMRFVPRVGDKVTLADDAIPMNVTEVIWPIGGADYDVLVRFGGDED